MEELDGIIKVLVTILKFARRFQCQYCQNNVYLRGLSFHSKKIVYIRSSYCMYYTLRNKVMVKQCIILYLKLTLGDIIALHSANITLCCGVVELWGHSSGIQHRCRSHNVLQSWHYELQNVYFSIHHFMHISTFF